MKYIIILMLISTVTLSCKKVKNRGTETTAPAATTAIQHVSATEVEDNEYDDSWKTVAKEATTSLTTCISQLTKCTVMLKDIASSCGR